MGVSQCIHVVTSGVHIFLVCEGIRLGAKVSFPIVVVVVACMQIKLGVDLGRAELVDEVGDQRDWISIPLSDLIELPKVNTESKGAILLLARRPGTPTGEFDAQMKPLLSMLSR